MSQIVISSYFEMTKILIFQSCFGYLAWSMQWKFQLIVIRAKVVGFRDLGLKIEHRLNNI